MHKSIHEAVEAAKRKGVDVTVKTKIKAKGAKDLKRKMKRSDARGR